MPHDVPRNFNSVCFVPPPYEYTGVTGVMLNASVRAVYDASNENVLRKTRQKSRGGSAGSVPPSTVKGHSPGSTQRDGNTAAAAAAAATSISTVQQNKITMPKSQRTMGLDLSICLSECSRHVVCMHACDILQPTAVALCKIQ